MLQNIVQSFEPAQQPLFGESKAVFLTLSLLINFFRFFLEAVLKVSTGDSMFISDRGVGPLLLARMLFELALSASDLRV